MGYVGEGRGKGYKGEKGGIKRGGMKRRGRGGA
jgi:hypothetical protein